MSGSTIGTIIFVIIVAAILIAVGVWLMNWLYRRSSKETSFVRTGHGGQRVVMNGGALVLPIIHDVIPVNMNTLRLEVLRGRESALITKNRMRIDVVAEFYVRVQPTPDQCHVRAACMSLPGNLGAQSASCAGDEDCTPVQGEFGRATEHCADHRQRLPEPSYCPDHQPGRVADHAHNALSHSTVSSTLATALTPAGSGGLSCGFLVDRKFRDTNAERAKILSHCRAAVVMREHPHSGLAPCLRQPSNRCGYFVGA